MKLLSFNDYLWFIIDWTVIITNQIIHKNDEVTTLT